MVRISSTGEIIHDERQNRSINKPSRGPQIESLSGSSPRQTNRQSSAKFGTINDVRDDHSFSGQGNQNGGGEAGNSRSVFGGPDRNGGANGHNNNRRGGGGGDMGNVFNSMNQKLIRMGIPRIPIGPIVVEPIVLAGLGLSYLVLGTRGLIFGGFLFGLQQYANLRT